MSTQDTRTSRHRHNSSPGHSSRRKHKSESKKTRERSRSPRHTPSHKRTKRSPSPSKHRTSKRPKDLPSPPYDTPDPVSNELISKSADSSIVTERTLLLKQKLEERKQKRQRNQSPVSEFLVIDDVRNWVDRSRQIEVAQNSSGPDSYKNTDIYASEDLKGMKIGHSVGGFLEGDEKVLTLKDRDILDEETEETLENPTMLDQDVASKKREARSLRPGVADPFDDSTTELENIESALRGETLVRDVLTKYDEEISGEKTRSFYLSDHGQLNTDGSVLQENQKLESLLAQLGKKEVDLNFEHKFASQVMTSEEIAEKFRKIKKRRKVVPLRAEDLLKQSPLPSGDLGSRETSSPPPTVTTFQSRKVNPDDAIGPVESDTTPFVSELPPVEEDRNISLAIEKIRKLRETAFSNKQMDPIDRAAAIARQTQRIRPADKSPSSCSMIFDSTQEFVRSLNTQPSSLARSRLHESLTEIKTENENAMDVDSDKEGQRDGWKELRDGSDSRRQVKTEDRDDYFEAEPIVSHSLTSTLLLAERKGFIEQSRPKGYTEGIEDSKHKNDISARNYSLLDKQSRSGDQRERTRDRDDYRDRDRDSFPEIKNYVPEIKLEYVDDLGRDLSQKEAFRRMSHIFHGKGSGKLKAERRLKKSEDELTMLKMNSFDTPLNAVAMATRKMETSGIPYLILSGGQHSLETGSVTESSLTKKRRK